MKKSLLRVAVLAAVFVLGVWLGAEVQLKNAGFKKWGSVFTSFEGSNFDNEDEKTILVDISKALRLAVGQKKSESYHIWKSTGAGTLSRHPGWKILTYGQGGNTVAWQKKYFIFLDRTKPVVASWCLPLLVNLNENLKSKDKDEDLGVYKLRRDTVLVKYYPSVEILAELKSPEVYGDIWGRREGYKRLNYLAKFLDKDKNFRKAVQKAVADFDEVSRKYDALDFEKNLSELTLKGGSK